MRELAGDPSSRKRFLRMMGGAGARTETEQEMPARGDLAIVQYALTLEHLETDFYNAVR